MMPLSGNMTPQLRRLFNNDIKVDFFLFGIGFGFGFGIKDAIYPVLCAEEERTEALEL